MRFVNETRWPAKLVFTGEHDDRIRALAVVAITADVGPRRLTASVEPMPLETEPDCPYPNDVSFSRAGITSVCATGHAYPAKEGDRESMVRLRVGTVDRDIAVFGERRWTRGLSGAPAVGRAEPIVRVPMQWAQAYGGKVERPASLISVDGDKAIVAGHEASYPLNTDGLGFALDAKDAIGRPLPGLEDPEHLVTRWDDYPEPVCLAPYPLGGGLRMGFIVRADHTIDKSRLPALQSRAAPRGTFDPVEPGTTIALSGMSAKGALAFTVPEPNVVLEVAVGRDRDTFELALDAVDIDAEARRVRLLYRVGFRYDLFQFERRVAVLRGTAAMDAGAVMS